VLWFNVIGLYDILLLLSLTACVFMVGQSKEDIVIAKL